MILSKGKINLIKMLDSTAGRLFCLLLPRRDRNSEFPWIIKKILIIRPGGIGDAVLLVPAIQLLHKQFPDAIIDILAEKRNSGIFSLVMTVHSVYHYDRPKELLSVIQRKYDIVIDSEQWHRLTAVVARLMGPPISIGFATNTRKKLFTHPVFYSHDDHEAFSFLHLLSPVKCDGVIDLKRPFISIPSEVSEGIHTFLQPLSEKKLITVFPGGSIKQKRWGSQQFRDIAKLLVQKGYGVVIIGGKDDIQVANEICSTLPAVVNVCGKLSLVETAAVIKESALLVSGDSGIMHIASALGTRVLALFGPSNARKWAPLGNHSHIITKQLACSPCSKYGYTPRCKHDMACMKLITVNEVFENAVRLLES